MNCLSVISSNRVLSVCGEQPMAFATTWVVWRFLWDPLTNNLMRYNPFLVLKLHLVTRDIQLGLFIPCYLGISFRLPSFICVCVCVCVSEWETEGMCGECVYKEASTALGFHLIPQITFNFSCPSLLFLPFPIWVNHFNPSHSAITIYSVLIF